jgi:hypothetical protein
MSISGKERMDWKAPKLESLDIEKTLTGPVILDLEATRNGQDVFIGGPPKQHS